MNTSEIQAAAKVTSAHRSLGLLDLPSKVRQRIFRHLLVKPRGLRFYCWPYAHRVPVNVLRTNKLIHKEASAILYGENTFVDCCEGGYPIKDYPRVRNLMQNLNVDIEITHGYQTDKFAKLLQNFSDTSIARGTLVISFYLCGIDLPPLKEYMLWLSMLTNFRTIEVLFFDFEGHSLSPVFEYITPILESKLGDAEYFRPEGKVRMHGWYPEDGRVDTHGKHFEDKDGWYTEDEDGELSGDEDGELSGDEDGERFGDEDGERSGDENGEHTEVENGEHIEVENGEHTEVENGERSRVENGERSVDENGERSGDKNGEHTKVERAEADEDGLKYHGEVFEAGLRFHPRNHQNLDGSSQPES